MVFLWTIITDWVNKHDKWDSFEDLDISSCQQDQSGSKQAADDRWDSTSTFND